MIPYSEFKVGSGNVTDDVGASGGGGDVDNRCTTYYDTTALTIQTQYSNVTTSLLFDYSILC